MEPIKFLTVDEDISDHSDEFQIETNYMFFDPFKLEERKQELTDALKYCIDRLKDEQIIIDLQNSRDTISKRSQLMGKEIHRKIIDMLHFMKLEDDKEVIKYEREMLNYSLEELSYNSKEQEINSSKHAEKINTKQTYLSIEEHDKILEQLDNEEKTGDLTQEDKTSKIPITFIKEPGEYLIGQKRSIIQHEEKTLKKKCVEDKLESVLHTWFLQKRSIGDPVTEAMLKWKALEYNQLFNGSKGFFEDINDFMDKFKKKYNIKYLTNHGEKFSAEQDINDHFYQEFVKYITDNKIPLDNIYNADETGLNWKMLPNNYIFNSEYHLSETKSSESRVTLMVCTNATGSHKLPVFIIGKANNPHCLKNIKSLSVVYMKQKNAWMDNKLMSRWYREIFLPEIECVHRSNNEKCLLLIDNARSHVFTEHLNSINERCRVIFLPPDVTSLIQPMNQGIIEKLKKVYKKKLLRVMLTAESAKEIPRLLKSFDILKCIYFINEAWSEVTESDIKNGWRNFFPLYSDLELDSRSYLDMVTKIPKYNKITLKEINSWLHNDDNEQGWQVLDDLELALQKYQNNIDDEKNKEEENNEHSNDLIAKNVLDAINVFTSWYQAQTLCTFQDRQYLRKFQKRVSNKIRFDKKINNK
ncbi:Jerky protein-like protein-like [Camponotus floridanus]|uniref:Jerky protein-like protein-like n=1 Tax=Camponotus floridanus TaxID=104421 RepID=E2AJ41_CAMFO|nr:Jerky protein-like protein-like [Camponotus floridanus]